MPGTIAIGARKLVLAAAATALGSTAMAADWPGSMAKLTVTGNCVAMEVLYSELVNNCSAGQCDYILQVLTPNRKTAITIVLTQPPAHWTVLAPSLQAAYTNFNIQSYPLMRVPTASPVPPVPVSVTLNCPTF